ncbi:glutathione synthase [Kordiimonas sp. SCSIO 12610]|uniref:glutathione synthase n=1 Tax=Kordiimonas sp. SCSIO 12610 TaxID=2829597 RepID=UPI00210DE0B5|nr:glutathione synthase [Kordiimonas sp. SCSIO 12610]UTW55481.1 glutathione synthase [Kordiimonas sp. SCSIO 12610]
MATKTLKVAVQMDPMDTVNINGDSTFVLMLEAQERGHKIWHYLAEDLTYDEGEVRAKAHQVTVRREEGNHFTFGQEEMIKISEMDVVLMRQDPPFDMAYITATHLLDLVHPNTLVVNNPTEVRNAPEKLFVTQFLDLMPPTMITRREDEVKAFREKHGEIIIKPLYGNGGAGVFHLRENDSNLGSLMEMFLGLNREPVMVQKFLPDVVGGDKRIILIDGEAAGAVNRIPAKGEIRSNLVAGGAAAKSILTEREQEICARLGPELKKRGLIFVGIDVIGDWLTEINVTSPTGLQSINAFDGVKLEADIWKAIESKIA